jgi:hypothetical protein
MRVRFPMYVVAALFSVSLGLTGCSRNESTTTAPAAPTPVSLTAEPSVLTPEFVPGGGCHTDPAFGVRFAVGLSGPNDVYFRRLRFHFHDRFGRVDNPRVTLNNGAPPPPSSLPTSGPVPFPSSSPIPMPGANTPAGMLTSFGHARRLPLWLDFTCGIAPSGTLVVIVDFDDHGRSLSAETRVPVQ